MLCLGIHCDLMGGTNKTDVRQDILSSPQLRESRIDGAMAILGGLLIFLAAAISLPLSLVPITLIALSISVIMLALGFSIFYFTSLRRTFGLLLLIIAIIGFVLFALRSGAFIIGLILAMYAGVRAVKATGKKLEDMESPDQLIADELAREKQ